MEPPQKVTNDHLGDGEPDLAGDTYSATLAWTRVTPTVTSILAQINVSPCATGT